MTIDKAVKVREEDGLPLDKLQDYLKHLPELEGQDTDIEIFQYPSGASNLTYELKLQDKSLILRTAPKGANIKSAHDMKREFKVLSKLGGHFNYCPKPLAFCDDVSIIGRDFYLMEKVSGMIPRKIMPVEYSDAELKQICINLMDVHIKLHEIDIVDTGLIEMGKPEGYVSRQISGWCERYKNARTDDVPDAVPLMDYLIDNQPCDLYQSREQASFIHNDFKLDNIVLDLKDTTKIISVLDWEMATVGDPLMDLGASMAYWVNADDPVPMQQIAMMPTNQKGMMKREELVDYYLSERGLSIKSFDYYYCFGLFRLAVIAQQIYHRYKFGQTTNPKFASFGQIVNILIGACKRFY